MHLSNVKTRSKFNHQMCAMIYGSYALTFKVLYDTRRTLRHARRPLIIMKSLSQGFTTLHKASHAARIPWQGNQRLRSTANDRYRPHSSFVIHNRRQSTNNLDETVSPSVRPSVRCGGFVLRYIVQACLLRETNGAPLVHSTPSLNSCEREIHRSPELKHPELRVLPDYLHCTTILLASTLTASRSPTVEPGNSKLCSCLCCLLVAPILQKFGELPHAGSL